MEEPIIFTLFEHLPRQGPGSSACTQKMFSLIPSLPAKPKILDIGCGSGMQTIDLTRLAPAAQITAVDVHAAFLADVRQRAFANGVAARLKTVQASMDSLPFLLASYDLIWAEGSIFIIGVQQGLSAWKKFLRSGGYLALTEAVWFTETPSDKVKAFWQENYPAITSVDGIRVIAENTGYSWITSFPLPASAWWDNYYTPLLARLPVLEEKYRDNAEAQGLIAGMKKEIQLYRQHSHEYGYQFILLKNGK
jgi:SAM-dependent methyltransferase